MFRDGPESVLEGVADGVADDRRLVDRPPLPPCLPPSMYFLALSQAPPALAMKIAIMTPVTRRAGEEAAEGLHAPEADRSPGRGPR
jgi:hypothetical protein